MMTHSLVMSQNNYFISFQERKFLECKNTPFLPSFIYLNVIYIFLFHFVLSVLVTPPRRQTIGNHLPPEGSIHRKHTREISSFLSLRTNNSILVRYVPVVFSVLGPLFARTHKLFEVPSVTPTSSYSFPLCVSLSFFVQSTTVERSK